MSMMSSTLWQRPQKAQATTIPSGMWRALAGDAALPKLPSGIDAVWANIAGWIQTKVPRRALLLRRARRIHAMTAQYRNLSAAEMSGVVGDYAAMFRLFRDKAADIDGALAAVCEVSRRELGLSPHVVQIAGALGMIQGCLVEMATGEGKTLTASLAASVLGWRGRGVHVITVNDYLAERDPQILGKLYGACGLRVSFVGPNMPGAARRAAYAADVTYCTNKEVTADYLKDRLALGRMRDLPSMLLGKITDASPSTAGDRLCQRGLHYAIVDEADSVLIDEAVTPLIISGEAPNAEEQAQMFIDASDLADSLDPAADYRVDHRWHEIRLTQSGRNKLEEAGEAMGGLWRGRRRREELVVQGLTAREFYHLDRNYVVQEGKIVIVDDFTGRLMPDRTWRGGLHQAVEAKEKLEVQPPKRTMARISFQRFFRLYRHLCGMTGTGWESRVEMWRTYKMPVVRIPTNKTCLRTYTRDRIYRTSRQRWDDVAAMVRKTHESGRPVLVGTRSVEASEKLGSMLAQVGIDCRILNAVRHKEEAQIVAGAGGEGEITVATNMAGRGTDIKLGRGINDMGGLHVIATERHESGRVDRQLFGRAARQGDRGSACAMISLEDDLFKRYGYRWSRWIIRMLTGARGWTSNPLAIALMKLAQSRAQNAAVRQRAGVVQSDDWLDENLSFAPTDA